MRWLSTRIRSIERRSLVRIRPYSQFARTYDRAVGRAFFRHLRPAFERIVRRYGVRFKTVADLGCGTGMFARYLRRRFGAIVYAVDISSEMLREARRRSCDDGLVLLRQDIRDLQLPRRVDLVTSNFDTLNHLVGDNDLRRAVHAASRALRPGGHFFFDLVTPCQPLGGARVLRRRFRTFGGPVLEHVRWEPARRTLSIHVVHRDLPGVCPTIEVHRERAYTAGEVSRWLDEAGFVVRTVRDAATLRPAVACPPRVIVLAQKRTGSSPTR